MTDSQSKKSGGKLPISRHPLFPATVALWFGALFGLGSMAIRPSLLEKAVLAIQLPAVIPAAEPPLGATTQILIAVASALVGGVLGAVLARRIGRPRKTAPMRKRGIASTVGLEAVAEVGMPVDLDDDSSSTPTIRRRPLAMQDGARPSDYQERAPLPGSSPQMFNVTEFDLEGFEAEVQEPEQASGLADDDWLPPEAADAGTEDLAGVDTEFEDAADLSEFEELNQGSMVEEVSFPETEADGLQGRPFGPGFAAEQPDADGMQADFSPSASTGRHSLFSKHGDTPAAEPGDADAFASDDDALEPEEAPVDQVPSPLAPFAAPSTFSEPDVYEEEEDVAELMFAATDAAGATPWAASPDGEQDEQLTAERTLDAASHQNGSAGDAREALADTVANRLMSKDLDALSHAELLERLALSLAGKRASTLSVTLAAISGDSPDDRATGAVGSNDALDVAAVDARDPREDAAPAGVDEQIEEEAAGATPDGIALLRPAPSIPAALRPIEFDDDGDTDPMPDFVPPRRFTMTNITADSVKDDVNDVPDPVAETLDDETGPPAKPDSAIGDVPDSPESGESNESADEERELEEGYSSLLSLTRPGRQQFVRIDEPESDDGEIRPFVVFPNDEDGAAAPFARPGKAERHQAANQQANDEAPPPVDASGEEEERRFDRPATGDASASAAQQPDPEETERSLRAALATLQRMSGAA